MERMQLKMDLSGVATREYRCGRCNRKLKDQHAQELGYGKVCYRKINADQQFMKGRRTKEKTNE